MHCEKTGETKYPHRNANDIVFRSLHNWGGNRNQLWNAAEASENRKNSCVARELQLALPKEVTDQERQDLAVGMAEELVTRYQVAVDVSIHRPPADDTENWHAHIMFTTRGVESDELKSKTKLLDARATGPKEVVYLRELWADMVNQVLPEELAIDHRSLEDQGVTNRQAGMKEGPAINGMKKKGKLEELSQLDRWQEIERRNGESDKLKEIENVLGHLQEQKEEIVNGIDGTERTGRVDADPDGVGSPRRTSPGEESHGEGSPRETSAGDRRRLREAVKRLQRTRRALQPVGEGRTSDADRQLDKMARSAGNRDEFSRVLVKRGVASFREVTEYNGEKLGELAERSREAGEKAGRQAESARREAERHGGESGIPLFNRNGDIERAGRRARVAQRDSGVVESVQYTFTAIREAIERIIEALKKWLQLAAAREQYKKDMEEIRKPAGRLDEKLPPLDLGMGTAKPKSIFKDEFSGELPPLNLIEDQPKLKKSIFKDEFSGELPPLDLNEESPKRKFRSEAARELHEELKRIREESEERLNRPPGKGRGIGI